MIVKNKKFNNLRQINIDKGIPIAVDFNIYVATAKITKSPKMPTEILECNNKYKNINDIILEFLKHFQNMFLVDKPINLYFKSIEYKSSNSINIVKIQILINEESPDNKVLKYCTTISGAIKVQLQDINRQNIYIMTYIFDTKEIHVDSHNWIGSVEISKDN